MKVIFETYLPIPGQPGEGLSVYSIPAEEPFYVGCSTAFSPLSKWSGGGQLEFSSRGRAIGYLKKRAKANGMSTSYYFIYSVGLGRYRIASLKSERLQHLEQISPVVTVKDLAQVRHSRASIPG